MRIALRRLFSFCRRDRGRQLFLLPPGSEAGAKQKASGTVRVANPELHVVEFVPFGHTYDREPRSRGGTLKASGTDDHPGQRSRGPTGFIDTSPANPVLYNVVHAVGVNAPNHRDDTMMVQYLLLHFYKHVKPKEAVPKGNKTVDGICGGITINWIKKFRIDLMFLNHSIYADGWMDRIRNTGNLMGSISKTSYSLARLNWYLAHGDPAAYAALPLQVPLQNSATVPPPSPDIVKPKEEPPKYVPTTGGV